MRNLGIICALLLAIAIATPMWQPPPLPPTSAATPGNAQLRPAHARAQTAPSQPSSLERTVVANARTDDLAHTTVATTVFRITGVPDQAGIAMVRRKDGSTINAAFTDGVLTVDNPDTLCGVAIRAPGFAVAWPRLTPHRDAIDVAMQRAGTIVVRLRDRDGRPLAHRSVWCICQQASTQRDTPYQGNQRAVTDANGVATLEHLVPGRYRAGAERCAEWLPVVEQNVVVDAGEATALELAPETWPHDRYGGFRFSMRDVPPPFDDSDNATHSHSFQHADGREWMLYAIGSELRCVAPGRPGDVIVGRIVRTPVDGAGPAQPVTSPILLAIGTVVPIQPIWLAALR